MARQRRREWTGTRRWQTGALRVALIACRWLAGPIAAAHALLCRARLVAASPVLGSAPGGLLRALHAAWFGRLARETLSLALRTAMRPAATGFVSPAVAAELAGPGVIAICHSPWTRLLAAWCGETHFALAPGPDRWAPRSGAAHVGFDRRGLRRLVTDLAHGGRVVVVADAFECVAGVATRFLGEERIVSCLAARLAALGHVPLVAVVPVLERGRVRVGDRATIRVAGEARSQQVATGRLIAFFDDQIRRRPWVWDGALGEAPSPPRAARGKRHPAPRHARVSCSACRTTG
jgi:hypothetical protein